MQDPSRYLAMLNEANNPTDPEEMKKLLEAMRARQGGGTDTTTPQPTTPAPVYQSTGNPNSFTDSPTAMDRNQRTMRSNPTPAPNYNTDPWAPLRSVAQPLNRRLGNAADYMVNRFQR